MAKTKRVKHVPIRTCIVTGEKKSKSELMRLVRTPEGVKVDPKGKIQGRGANILPDIKVLDQAIKKGIIKRALQLEKALTADQIATLRSEFEEAIEEKFFRKGRKRVTVRVTKLGKKELVDKVEEK